MKITKMHGLGNNYIYVSTWEEPLDAAVFPRLAVAVSHVRTGIGSDGLVVIERSPVADVHMRIFNADGSEAENCGNALRCVAKYAYEHKYVSAQTMTISLQAGVVHAEVLCGRHGTVEMVTVDMGIPTFGSTAVGYTGPLLAGGGDKARLSFDGQAFDGTLVSVGNPHFVARVDDAVRFPVEVIGPQIERHRDFANRINVEFVTPITRDELAFRVWERGSGVTWACGTGACAAVAVGIREGWLDARVTVHLLGGDLEIEKRDENIWMTGEAVHVFSGDYAWP